jgi:uncharacterized protein (TIGR03067 family)
MRTLIVFTMLCATLTAAPVPKVPPKTTFEQMQGEWVCVKCDNGSQKGEIPSERFLKVNKDGASDANGDKTILATHGITLDAEATPMRMDLRIEKTTAKGIVKVEGDRLYWCLSAIGSSSPTTFKGGSGCYCLIYERVPAK